MNKNLLIAAGLFVVLGAGWFATRSAPSANVKTLAVSAVARDKVKKVSITVPGKEKPVEGAPADAPAAPSEKAPDQHVVLEKSGDGFVVYAKDAADKRFPVEQPQIDAVLDAVAEFKPGDRISSKAEKLKELEIDDAQATHVTIESDDGTVLDLLFGRAAKSGGTTVRQAGSNDVFVAKGRLGAVVKKELSAWRKKAIVGKKADDFTAITIAKADGASFTLTGTSEEVPAPAPAAGDDASAPPPAPQKKTTWALTAPSTLPANFRIDTQGLSRVASALGGVRAADFADGVTDDVAGFAAPHTVVTGTLADGKTVVLHLGKSNDKKQVYARVDGDTQVYLLAEFTAKNLDKGLDDVRDLTVFSAKADEVTEATFVSGKTKIVVKKDGDAWKLVEPKTAPAELEVAQIGSAVAAALRIKGSRVVSDVADAGGKDPSIVLTTKSGTQTVQFGKAVDGSNDVLVKGADGLVYAVSSNLRGRYEKPVELFKKPPAPPPGMGGGMGGMQGLESLPPDVRAKLEASMKQQGM
jgi:hypothetical protein